MCTIFYNFFDIFCFSGKIQISLFLSQHRKLALYIYNDSVINYKITLVLYVRKFIYVGSFIFLLLTLSGVA